LTRSLIAAPLIASDDVHGVLLIADARPAAFDELNLQLVVAAARQVAQMIGNAQLYNYVLESAQRLGQLLRNEQEERSKSSAILHSIADGVIVNDTQGRVIALNAAAAKILEIQEDAALGQDVRTLFDAFENDGRGDLLSALDTIGTSPYVSAGQVIETMLESETKIVSAHLAPVVTETGESLGIVTALRDITREVEADRAKSEFVSTVSHELRTPLTSIKGYTDLVYAGAVGEINEQQQRFLSIIKNNADRLTALIGDLLDMSRIETGRLKLSLESVDLIQVIHEVVESMRTQIEGKGLDLKLELPAEAPTITGDRSRLIQVVTNLVSNAFKYTDQGWIRVCLSPLRGAVRLDVADSGIGISGDDLGKIFERFYRANTPVMDGRGGTGLGLAIAKQLVEMHGGRVWVKSELNVGSTFTVILPTAAQELPLSLVTELPAGAKKVLVVDDERDIVALLRHQLGTHGYHVLTASTGAQAIARAIEEQPDLITLDILLPDRHGFEVLRELKSDARTAHIPVIVLSVVQDETSGYRLGAVDHIVKPIDERRLLDSMARALSHKGKILIAEDTPDTATMLIELLKRHDYEPLHAVNGYETLALARRERPGLILLDLRMPGMDGYEALTRLKKDPTTKDIPIVVMSAHAADPVQERLRLRAMGAEDFLSKPLSLEKLLAEIERVAFSEDLSESSDTDTP
jgi:PAS domain S-box-containing protein